MTEPAYELFAIRYATREARRSDHFIGGDPHDGPMPMDYFMWLAKGEGRTFVIDTGFGEEVAERRKRTFLRCPVEALALFDVDPNTVEDVILTHLHYDHVGNFDRFPRARFHLQHANSLTPPGNTCATRGWRIPSRWKTSAASCG
jgi:glyoxylase-like metal-dependent hydrolase (beta-lactamase superfamily II)